MDKREQLIDIMEEAAKGETKATLRARIAELEAEIERLREGCQIESPCARIIAMARAHTDASKRARQAEALSRTGAVKVKALEWEERKTRLGTVWWRAPNPLGGLSIEAASENDKIAAQADYERRILSALEPAAPEGRQDDEPRAYIVHAPEDEYYGTGPDRLQFHPLAQRDMDNGYRQTPLYGRPAEQAATDEMVEAAVQAVRQYTRETLFIDEHRELVRTALKAAMEAGR